MTKSPTAQEAVHSIPGLISSTRVLKRWILLSHAREAVKRGSGAHVNLETTRNPLVSLSDPLQDLFL